MTAEEIRDELTTLGPQWIIDLLTNADALTIAAPDSDPPTPSLSARTVIEHGSIRLRDENGNVRVLTATGDE